MIRPAIISDLDSIEKGYHAHFLHEKEHGAFTVFKEGVYPTRNDAEKALQHEALFVVEENGIVVGSIILDSSQPEEYASIDWPCQATPEQVCVIHLLMVLPCMAGKGIGSALVTFALEEAKRRSCITVRLDTGEQNIPAASLYKRLDFQLIAKSTMKVGGAIPHGAHLFFEKQL